jgi:hypothetical protein
MLYDGHILVVTLRIDGISYALQFSIKLDVVRVGQEVLPRCQGIHELRICSFGYSDGVDDDTSIFNLEIKSEESYYESTSNLVVDLSDEWVDMIRTISE